MKKFTNLNESNNTVNKPINRNDFIKKLINDTLKVEKNEIKGKDILEETISRILELNESKSFIKALELVKAKSYRTLNLQWINESIEEEKRKMKKCKNDECENDEEYENINEGFNVEFEIKVTPIECENNPIINGFEEPINNPILDEFEEPDDNENEENEENGEDEENEVFVESVNYLQDIADLSSILKNINEEHHLETKEDKLNYIFTYLVNDEVFNYVNDIINELPDYVKTPDLRKTLKNLSDKEIHDIYLGVEEIIGKNK